jgi:hypothetical protein
VHLTSTDDLTDEIDALASRHGGRLGLDGLLSDLDRRLRRTWAPCLSRHRAWTWEPADRRDPGWWPQGISANDQRPGLLAVSWYATAGGSRVSFLDVRSRRYRHVTLVRPTATGHEPLRIHAGGLAWVGRELYVAATRAGLWVCETDDVLRADGDVVLPVRRRLSAVPDEGDDPFRFSFVSTVPGRTDEVIVGEYGNRSQSHRMAHLPVDGGRADVVDGGAARAQGVVLVDGRYVLTSSHGPRTPGSLHVGGPGALRERRWALPMGPEDLAYSAAEDRLWTVTEHPRRRWVVSLRPPRG